MVKPQNAEHNSELTQVSRSEPPDIHFLITFVLSAWCMKGHLLFIVSLLVHVNIYVQCGRYVDIQNVGHRQENEENLDIYIVSVTQPSVVTWWKSDRKLLLNYLLTYLLAFVLAGQFFPPIYFATLCGILKQQRSSIYIIRYKYIMYNRTLYTH